MPAFAPTPKSTPLGFRLSAGTGGPDSPAPASIPTPAAAQEAERFPIALTVVGGLLALYAAIFAWRRARR